MPEFWMTRSDCGQIVANHTNQTPPLQCTLTARSTTWIYYIYTKAMSLTNASAEDAARAAKLSSRKLATLPTSARNDALDAVHDALAAARDDILTANAKDLELAQKSAKDGQLNPSIVKRLDLSRPGKFEDMLQGIKDVRNLEDPGRCFNSIFSFLSLFSQSSC